ncbi:hypothetical protein QDX25_07240 [Auritidibacter ignavus]|uniref:hypothetical protein n=1 Tax=Auritidibacter ignavus TaxID=678932 RepID=UPI00244D12D3|nr:hypothetical protein [Auritidibacter ignavus]WGH80602.1 hypothetical protein QDX25_07240 [Auritidibacter ignavus]
MATTDKPTIHESISNLKKETPEAEVFTVALSNNKRITFPDPYAMEQEEAESVFAGINGNSRSSEVIRTWLSDEDYQALKAEKLRVMVLTRLVRKAVDHYENFYGGLGESDA